MDTSKPLAPAPLHILLALLAGTSHGYGLLRAVREQSGGRVPLGTASLYRHLARLIDAGLIVDIGTRPADDLRRGVYYRLTPRGRQALSAERDRLAGLVAALDRLQPLSRKSHS